MSEAMDGRQESVGGDESQEIAAGGMMDAHATAGEGAALEEGSEAGDLDMSRALEADLRKLHDERNSLFEQLARVQADFRNAQKRLEGEKMMAVQFANSKLLTALLPVIDNFERALSVEASGTDAAAVLKGLEIVHDQLLSVLGQQHVEVIAPEAGTPFDPNMHEAVMQQEAEGKPYKEPTVTQLLQKGYSVHGRVLRPAQVAVSRTE
jgi:molecular chaperone GrpE